MIKSRLVGAGLIVAAGLGFASSALGQFTPPTFDEIIFPIDTATIATTVGAAGASILILAMGWKGGFRLVGTLFFKLFGAIR
ncbi:MAG: hypothetical protein AAF937_09440 [Planctomycetota bacterium]